MSVGSELFWACIGALLLGAPVGAVWATFFHVSSDVDVRDRDRADLGLDGHSTPPPWHFHRVERRIVAPSVVILDSSDLGPSSEDGYGLTPSLKYPEGLLVCESVHVDDGPLIAAAPKLLEIAKAIRTLSTNDEINDLISIRNLAREVLDEMRQGSKDF